MPLEVNIMRRFPQCNVQAAARTRDFEVRLPGRGLRCDCGYRLAVHDFDVTESGDVHSVCSRCHADLLIIGPTENPSS
jgi:hypothetical protein